MCARGLEESKQRLRRSLELWGMYIKKFDGPCATSILWVCAISYSILALGLIV